MIMKNVAQNEKLALFLDHFDQKWNENKNIAIAMWYINNHWHRTNSAVQGWNYELHSTTVKRQPYVCLQTDELKGQADLLSWQLKSKETEEFGLKRRKINVKQEERINNTHNVGIT